MSEIELERFGDKPWSFYLLKQDEIIDLEKFVTARSKQVVMALVQYMAMGGTESTALLEGRKTLDAIEHQKTVPLLITDGPKLIECPLGCGEKFATAEDLRNHLIKSHGALP